MFEVPVGLLLNASILFTAFVSLIMQGRQWMLECSVCRKAYDCRLSDLCSFQELLLSAYKFEVSKNVWLFRVR